MLTGCVLPGLLGGLIGLCCIELYYIPPTAWVTLGVLLASGLLMALLNLYFQVMNQPRCIIVLVLVSVVLDSRTSIRGITGTLLSYRSKICCYAM